VCAMVRPDCRKIDLEDRRSELKVTACLLMSLAIGTLFVGTVFTMLWPVLAYQPQW
jgi:hypothetical protein